MVWAEPDRSNFNQVDFGSCQCSDRVTEMPLFDWQVVSQAVPQVVLFFVPVHVCVGAAVSGSSGSWRVQIYHFFRISCWSELVFPTSIFIRGDDFHQSRQGLPLWTVWLTLIRRTEPTAFRHLNHPTCPWVGFHNSLLVLRSRWTLTLVTVTPFQHIRGVFSWSVSMDTKQTIGLKVYGGIVYRFMVILVCVCVCVQRRILQLISEIIYFNLQRLSLALTLPGSIFFMELS